MAYRVHYHRNTGLRGRWRARQKTRAKRMAIAVAIMLLLFVIVGVIYTWYMGLYGDKKISAPLEKAQSRKEHTPPPTDPNAPVGVYIQSIMSEITPGSNDAISIRTQPQADCVIKVTYGGIESKDSGLSPKRADEYGFVKWSWTVDPTTPLGKGAVDVTCARNKQSGYMHGDFVIVEKLSQP